MRRPSCRQQQWPCQPGCCPSGDGRLDRGEAPVVGRDRAGTGRDSVGSAGDGRSGQLGGGGLGGGRGQGVAGCGGGRGQGGLATTKWALPLWSGRLLAGVDGKTPVVASGEEALVVAASGEASFATVAGRGLWRGGVWRRRGRGGLSRGGGEGSHWGGGSINRDAARAGMSLRRMTTWRQWLAMNGTSVGSCVRARLGHGRLIEETGRQRKLMGEAGE